MVRHPRSERSLRCAVDRNLAYLWVLVDWWVDGGEIGA